MISMRHRTFLCLSGLASLFLFPACDSDTKATTPVPPSTVAKYQACTQDSDCVVVRNGCCCDSVAINKDLQDEFAALFSCEQVCACSIGSDNVACTAGMCAISS